MRRLSKFINKRGKRLFYKEVLISLVLLSMPFWYLLMRIAPKENFYKNNVFTFDSKNFNYDTIEVMVWVFLLKLIPLTILLIWYLACKYWWRSAILVPLIFSLAQFLHLFNNEEYVDKGEFWIALLASLPIILFFIWFSKKFSMYKDYLRMGAEIQNEIEALLSIDTGNKDGETQFLKFLVEFNSLKRRKLFISEEHYLYQMLALKSQLILNLEINK